MRAEVAVGAEDGEAAHAGPAEVGEGGGRRLPDWLARFIRFAMSTAPRWLEVRIMGQVMRGMTGGPKPVAAG